jgi:alginate O-acetyltransferase complex protein AlgI
MAFNSLSYFVFLPLVYLVFCCAGERYRWLVLLLASYGFYAALKAPQLLVALLLVTAVSYACGRRMGEKSNEGERRTLFWIGTSCCLLILASLKYLPALLSGKLQPAPAHLLISIGVSYFSLQAVSYLADIYLETLAPERHLGHHALQLAFFPKLLQGPIERGGVLLPQLKKPYLFDYQAMRSAALLFSWGMFKKVVVADRLALYANTVYGDVHAFSGLPLLLATYAYALQIYLDFSGYTDMARGTARIFNIELSENFRSPYLATSVAEFWRRWHISFSSWILDYIFKPLQMAWRGQGKAGSALALMVTFLFSGVWHGASWGFVVWGALHGAYLASSVFISPALKQLYRRFGIERSPLLLLVQIAVTFNLVSFAWIFFRAATLSDAIFVARGMFASSVGLATFCLGRGNTELLITWGLLLLVTLAGYAMKHDRLKLMFQGEPWVRWGVYYCLIMLILLLNIDSNNAFVYFQF